MTALLLYDADCGFCTRTADLARRLPIRAEIVALQSRDLAVLGVCASRAEQELPFVAESGEVSYGHRAVAAVLQTAPAPLRWVGRGLTVWPVEQIAAALYRLIARNRHLLPGGSATCSANE